MLPGAKAFSGFAVDDIPRAKQFYGGTLGLEVADAALGVDGADVPAVLEIHLGPGTRILVYPKPDHTPATFTILNFDQAASGLEVTASGWATPRPGWLVGFEGGSCSRRPRLRRRAAGRHRTP
jgi:catechol 2,3-dioxygenase-like lactoylglutathione lyase family enzyme